MRIKNASLKKVAEVNSRIPEFNTEQFYDEEHFRNCVKGKKKLLLVACLEGKPVGYLVSYDRDSDGSFYAWMGGVDPQYRRRGIMNALINHLETWCLREGYKTLKVKTRNNKREMLHLLVSNHFMFTEVISKENIEENRVLLEKSLE